MEQGSNDKATKDTVQTLIAQFRYSSAFLALCESVADSDIRKKVLSKECKFEDVTIASIDKTIRHWQPQIPNSLSTFGYGIILLGVYPMFILPKEVLYEEFLNYLCRKGKIFGRQELADSLHKFILIRGDGQESKLNDRETLEKLRNWFAHGNFCIEPSNEVSGSDLLITFADYPPKGENGYISRVKLTQIAQFNTQFASAWCDWFAKNQSR